MMPPATGDNDALSNRLLATLADVPPGQRPHFGRIAHQLKITNTELTVCVWQLVNSGRIDRATLRPPSRQRPRPYCQQPDFCQAMPTGACRLGCRPTAQPARPQRRASKPNLTEVAALRMAGQQLIWCGQCDRRVAAGKAAKCESRWCTAELPPALKECRL